MGRSRTHLLWWQRLLGGGAKTEEPPPVNARAGARQWAAQRAARKEGWRGQLEIPAEVVRDHGGRTDLLTLPWGEDRDLPRGARATAYPGEVCPVVVEYDWSEDRVVRIVRVAP